MKLLQADLNLSAEAIRLWIARSDMEFSEENAVIGLALFRDAIIQLFACFSPPGEHLDAKQTFGGVDGGMTYFNWLRSIRDTYAAHRFGPLRQSVPAVVQDDDMKVMGIGSFMMVYQGPGEGHEDLRSFFAIACQAANAKIAELEQALLEEARNMDPLEIANLPIATLTPIENDLIRTVRDRHSTPKSRRRTRGRNKRGQGRAD